MDLLSSANDDRARRLTWLHQATTAPREAVAGTAQLASALTRDGHASSNGFGAGIIELFERARQIAATQEIDVVILSARRLSCLYQLAISLGFEPLTDVLVVSDRYLDVAKPKSWAGMRVLILDDSVVLGTTLFGLSERVRCLVGERGVVLAAAYCRDAGWSADFLVDAAEVNTITDLSSDDVKAFSLLVVRALFLHQIPFFSDFPVSVPVAVDRDAWAAFLERGPWAVADVTAPLIADEDHWSLSIIPDNNMVDAVLSRLPSTTASLVESFKLRAYVAREKASLSTRRVRLVPIAMLGACQPSSLDGALNEAAKILAVPAEVVAELELEPDSKHRLVQMFASMAVLAAFLGRDELNGIAGAGAGACPDLVQVLDKDGVDEWSTRLYFGDVRGDIMICYQELVSWMATRLAADNERPYNGFAARPASSPLLHEPDVVETLWAQRELVAGSTEMPARPPAGRMVKMGLILEISLASIFGYISRTRELDQRRRIKDMKSVGEFRASGLAGDQRVLNQGFTLAELTESLYPELAAGPIWRRSLLSLGIDIGNDLGIVVPDTRVDLTTGLVYRCYRLGETAYLADRPLGVATWDSNTPGQVEGTYWDEVSREARSGYPIMPHDQEVGDPRPLASEPSDTSNIDAMNLLESVVLSAVPGRFAHYFEGTVAEVEDDALVVDLLNLETLAPATARLGFDWLRPRLQRGDLDVDAYGGARFYWATYSLVGDPDRESTHVRFQHRAVDSEHLQRAGSYYAALVAQESVQ